jgi:hypothetical protein
MTHSQPRPRLRRAGLLAAIVVFGLAAAGPANFASACSCAPRPVCQSYWEADAVFLGTVTEIVPRDHEQLLDELKQLAAALGFERWNAVPKESNLTPDQHRSVLEWRKSVALRNWGPRLTDDARKAIQQAETFGEIEAAVNDLGAPRRWVRLEANEVFRGDAGDEIELSTGYGGGECGYPFELGGQYLVFAFQHRDSGSFSTGICSATAPAPESRETIEWIRGIESSPDLSRIFGTVRAKIFDPYGNRRYTVEPLRDVPVLLQSSDGSATGKTGADGRFLFDNLAPGAYRLAAQAPGFAFPRPVVDVNVPERGCAQISFFGEPLRGAIRGRLFQHDGQPLAGIEVEAAAVNAPHRGTDGRAKTRPDGTFEITDLAEGDYFVGVNLFNAPNARRGRFSTSDPRPYPRTYYPGAEEKRKAVPVHLAPGGSSAPVEWRMPEPLEERTIQGTVVWPEDSGITGGSVSLQAAGFIPSSASAKFGADGRFELTALEGLEYELVASASLGEKLYRATAKLGESESGPVVVLLKRAERTHIVK